MILADFLKGVSDTEMLYIGSKGSFFFIGSKAELLRDSELINEELIDNCQRSLRTAQRRLWKRQNSGLIMDSRFVNANNFEQKYKQGCDLTYHEMKNIDRTIRTHKKYLATYEDVLKRNVRDSYPRLQNDGTIILIKGLEYGSFWYREDYLNRFFKEETQ